MSNHKFKKILQEYLSEPVMRVLGLISKELKILFNDKSAMIITYVLPLVVVIMLTIGSSSTEVFSNSDNSSTTTSTSSTEIPIIGIIDYDSSEGFSNRDLSKEFLGAFEEAAYNGQCHLIQSTNQTELEFSIGRGEIDAFIIIPYMFEYNLSIHLPVIVPTIYDSINSGALQASQALVENIINSWKNDNDFTGVFNVQKNAVNLPEKFQVFFISMPTIISLAIFGIGCLTSTQCIVGDIPKDRMVLTPTNKTEMLAAKVLANFIIQMGVALMFILATILTGVPILGTYPNYSLILTLMVMNAVIIGVFISSIAKSPLAAFQFFIFLFIFQSIAIFFIEDPNILATLPMYNGHEMISQIVLRGQDLWSIREFARNIAIECGCLYFLTWIIFKKQKTML